MRLECAYLEKGLTCMSRSMVKSVWPAHYGAAVIAAYYYVEENDLSQETVEAIRVQADRMMEKHATYFEPWPSEASRDDAEDLIVDVLRGNVHKLCIGHNVIYSALAIKALRDTPGMHPPEMVAGLQDLIQAFDTIRFGMYIGGKGKGVEEMTLAADDDVPSSSEVGDIVALTFSEFLKFKQIYDLDIHKAQVGHLITHAHALVELLELGFPDLWEEGLTPFKVKVKILPKNPGVQGAEEVAPVQGKSEEPDGCGLLASGLRSQRLGLRAHLQVQLQFSQYD